jgi:RNA polymerase nonessential primary-like sigma factor
MANQTPDIVRLYLQEIGRYSLLTPEQEISCARKVQMMVAIKQKQFELTQQLNRQPTDDELATSLAQTEAEVQSIRNQGELAQHNMVTANLRLVVSIAKKYQNSNLELLDLIQEGTLGLHRGIEKFDPNKGYKLSTYVYWWIRQSITRAISEKSRTIRLPIHIVEKLNKIKKVQQELSQSLGRKPTVKEIAQSLKLTPEQIREYLLFSKNPVSLEMRVGDERETELSELLPDESSTLDEQVDATLMLDNLSKLLEKLTPVQQKVITWRFGLEDDCELTLSQISSRLNLSRERIRQIQYQAMAILRRQQDDIKEYLVN